MSQGLARFLVFATSASVLVLEVLAVRLLAPYLGMSLEVFTGIIGVVLAGISVGAWAGGRLADISDPTRLPGWFLIAGGLAAVASPLIVDLVGPGFSSSSTDPLAIVMVAMLAFFAPAAVLSGVPPVVVKIRLANLEETGTVVGSYSAIGTAGALVGTFVTGFVLIAAFPTRPVIFVVGGLLVATGAVLVGTRSLWAVAGIVALGAMLLVFDGPCQYETSYHCAIVVEDPTRPTGRTLLLDGVRNSYVDLADPTHLEFRYLRVIDDVVGVELGSGALTVVHVGGGGFTFPGYLASTRPGTSNTVLEIDRELIDIGMTNLGFDHPEAVVVGDARLSLLAVPQDSLDLVVGDAFSGYSVPWHLTTVEFIEEIAFRLRPGGIYVANIIDYPALDFVRRELASMLEVFDHVAVLAPATYLGGTSGGNFVVVGSDLPLDLFGIAAETAARGGVESALEGPDLVAFVGDAPALVDDFAPVDQLLTLPRLAG
jgi:MFS family permease